ncbi:unnamed protein product [Malus baccata var. baccata]
MSSSESHLPPCQFPLFLLFSLLAFFSLCSVEIRFSSIRSDWRPIIPFDEFGFTHKGLLELNVSKVVLSDLPQPNPDLSKVGFFLCIRDSWIHVFEQLDEGEIRCSIRPSTSPSTPSNPSTAAIDSLPSSPRPTPISTPSSSPTVSNRSIVPLWPKNDRRDYLSADKEKKVLMIVILLQVIANIMQVVIDEIGPFGHDWVTWKRVFLLVDVVCCCAMLFLIVWSIKNLREVARTNGKAAVNLMKWTLFRQYYIVVICYIYFSKVMVYALETITLYRYLWTSVLAAELATLALYVLTGYKFKPEAHNLYFVVDDEEEEAEA